MIRPQFVLDLSDELIVDNFAGGGGASWGIEMALGRHVDHAINHDRFALGMHRINHPQTIHHCEDIFDIVPALICEGRPVGLAHFSPDCKHFSKAKGGKPLDKRIRGLVLVMLRWAKYGARVMTMENVEEIVTWGPLKRMLKNGEWGMYPDPEHKGRTWLAFLAILGSGIDGNHPDLQEILEVLDGTVTKEECVRGFGYVFESRIIRACDLGTPTVRKRFYMVARCDGRPIVWPEPTHFDPARGVPKGGKPWRTIAECIEWARACPSIFLNAQEARAAKCKRPLARATLRRVAVGIDRHVLKSKRPFLVSLTHQGGNRVEGIDQPSNTVTGAHRGEKALVVPVITEHANSTSPRSWAADEPLRTACAEVKGGHFAMIAGSLVQTGYGEREGQEPRAIDPEAPLGTIVAGGGKHAVVTGTLIGAGGPAFSSKPKPVSAPMNAQTCENHAALVSATLVGAGGRAAQSRPRGANEPLATTTAKADTCVAAASLVKLRGDNIGQAADLPGATVSAGGTHHAVTAAFLARTAYKNANGSYVDSPMDPARTITAANDGYSAVAVHMTKFNTGAVGSSMDEPISTIPAGSHSPETHGGAATPHGMVAAYLAQHNSGFNETPGHPADAPVSTISATGSQQGVVAASLAAYYGNDAEGQAVTEPGRTVTTKDRLGLVESTAFVEMTEAQVIGARRVAAFLREHGVQFEGEFATVEGYAIVDIGLRMLAPRELFRAQGFPDDYVIDRAWVIDPKTGEIVEIHLTKEQQIRMCGNSVCRQVEAAIIRCNCPELVVRYGDEKKGLVTV